jgi:hypothetical protein
MPMTRLPGICAAVVMAVLPACSAQILVHSDKGQKPGAAGAMEATDRDLSDYVRKELLALSPRDGINDNLKVAFAPATSVLSIAQPDGRCDIFLNQLDAASASWEIYDPSDADNFRGQLLRLTLNAQRGRTARICYDNHHRVDSRISTGHARLLFSLEKANAVPTFAEDMDKAIRKLVESAPANPAAPQP